MTRQTGSGGGITAWRRGPPRRPAYEDTEQMFGTVRTSGQIARYPDDRINHIMIKSNRKGEGEVNREELIRAITELLDRSEYRILVIIYNMLLRKTKE